METLGPAGESLQIAERYRRMSDDELIALARETSALTDLAQQALAGELSHRRLKIPSEELATRSVPSPAPDIPDDDDPYAEEHELVQICTVWSLEDARQVQKLLETAGIPFYMGEEKATAVDQVTSNFQDGVSVGIMSVGVPWAREAMQHYVPKDAPAETEPEQSGEVAIHCPKCHSTEVVFDRLVNEAADSRAEELAKYRWTCDSCGNEWEDDGIETDH